MLCSFDSSSNTWDRRATVIVWIVCKRCPSLGDLHLSLFRHTFTCFTSAFASFLRFCLLFALHLSRSFSFFFVIRPLFVFYFLLPLPDRLSIIYDSNADLSTDRTIEWSLLFIVPCRYTRLTLANIASHFFYSKVLHFTFPSVRFLWIVQTIGHPSAFTCLSQFRFTGPAQ